VDDDRQRRAVGDRAKVLEEALLRRLVVVGRHRQETVRAGPAHVFGKMDHFARVVAAGAGEDRHAAAGLLDQSLDRPEPLLVRERRALAGGAARDQEVNAGVDLPAAEATDGRLVEVAGAGERCDQRRADSGEWRAHEMPPDAGLKTRATTVRCPARPSL